MLVTGQLADTPTRGLNVSQTGQLAVSQMPPKERKLSTDSRRWHPRVVKSATCLVRELSSPRVDQSARYPVRELAIRELAYPRVVQLPPASRGCRLRQYEFMLVMLYCLRLLMGTCKRYVARSLCQFRLYFLKLRTI